MVTLKTLRLLEVVSIRVVLCKECNVGQSPVVRCLSQLNMIINVIDIGSSSPYISVWGRYSRVEMRTGKSHHSIRDITVLPNCADPYATCP